MTTSEKTDSEQPNNIHLFNNKCDFSSHFASCNFMCKLIEQKEDIKIALACFKHLETK